MLARESLRELIDDSRLPPGVRDSLAHDYAAVEAMLDKLEHGHLHLAVFGRVSTGKSSLLNALIGEERFAVSKNPDRRDAWEQDVFYREGEFSGYPKYGTVHGNPFMRWAKLCPLEARRGWHLIQKQRQSF